MYIQVYMTISWEEHYCHFSYHRSDIGPDVGFEATGKINAKLPTVGIFARKSSEVRHNYYIVEIGD